MDDTGEIQNVIELETEWERVLELLKRKDETAWSLAIVEAHKIFAVVLEYLSYGPNEEERLQNASELFRDFAGLMTAQKVYGHVTGQLHHRTTREVALKTTDSYMQAILDLVGRDFEVIGWWHRLLNGQNMFWGHHPKLIMGVLVLILALVAGVWFFRDIAVGQWIGRILTSFADFILATPVLMVTLIVVLILSTLLSLVWVHRRRRDR